MLTILYSFGKEGLEASCWEREIAAASNDEFRFVPFNHRHALAGGSYEDAITLDRDHRNKSPRLTRLYHDVKQVLQTEKADCLFVTNDNVYHPEFLAELSQYRAYYTTDDPYATYIRTIPYLHAFHHVFHCAIPYAPNKTLREKLLECGARAVDFLPLGVFDFEMDPLLTEEAVRNAPRDIDLVYVGAPFLSQKLDFFVEMLRAFGPRFRLHGMKWKLKHQLYLSIRSGRATWVRPVSFQQRVELLRRAKIGFNVHWDRYGLGNQRLYHLPANGVMQISDCPEHLGAYYEPGVEVVGTATPGEMAAKIRYYLEHDEERRSIAVNGFRRVQRDYRIRQVLRKTGECIQRGMSTIGFDATARPR